MHRTIRTPRASHPADRLRGIALAGLAGTLLATTAAFAADEVLLDGGARLEGTVLKRTDAKLWLDIGPTVIEISMDDIAEVTSASGDSAPVVQREDDLFSIAQNPIELSPREHAKLIGPAVIKVGTPGGLGSGVIINEDGSAITNAHVIEGDRAPGHGVVPQPDGTLKRTVIEDIEIIAVNNHLDLALIKITHPDGQPFQFATVEPVDEVEGGQPVFAIGNPLGLEHPHPGRGVHPQPRTGRALLHPDRHPDQPGQLRGPPLQHPRGGHRDHQHDHRRGAEPRVRDPRPLRQGLRAQPRGLRLRQLQPQFRAQLPRPAPPAELRGARDAAGRRFPREPRL